MAGNVLLVALQKLVPELGELRMLGGDGKGGAEHAGGAIGDRGADQVQRRFRHAALLAHAVDDREKVLDRIQQCAVQVEKNCLEHGH